MNEVATTNEEHRILALTEAMGKAGIEKKVKTVRRLEARIANLQLFEDVLRPSCGGKPAETRRMSVRNWDDHPDIQVLLERQGHYLQLRQRLASAEEELNKIPAEAVIERTAMWSAIARIERAREQELHAIDQKLNFMRKFLGDHWKQIADKMTDVIAMVHRDKMHIEKMQLARELKGDVLDNVPDADLARD